MSLRTGTIKTAAWVVLTLFCLNIAFSAPPTASAMTIEEEKELGDKVLREIKKHLKLVEDEAINDYVNQLGQRILKGIGPQPYDYHFLVVDNPTINAFAIPGGNIFVNAGLITAMDSEGELAAVIAHEIAHVTSRHVSQRLDQARRLTIATMAGIIAGILVGGPVGQAIIFGGSAAGVQAQLAYSRADEQEADVIGLDYLVQAGYDPRFMAEAFKILLQKSFHSSDDIPTYLTTHPGLSERIAQVEISVHAKPEYRSVKGLGDQKAFLAVRNRLKALTADPMSTRNYFTSQLKKNPRDAWAHYGMAMLYQQEQDYTRAQSSFEEALKIDPNNPGIMTDYGVLLYKKRDFAGAEKVPVPGPGFETANGQGPLPPGPALRGFGPERQGDRAVSAHSGLQSRARTSLAAAGHCLRAKGRFSPGPPLYRSSFQDDRGHEKRDLSSGAGQKERGGRFARGNGPYRQSPGRSKKRRRQT